MNPFLDSVPILRTSHWVVILHRNQAYLGRCITYLIRECYDPLEITREERDVLWEVVFPRLRDKLGFAFQPDRYNYACFGNEVQWAHWHVIPRYQSPRVVGGLTFVDARWGTNYAPYTKDATPKEFEVVQRRLLSVTYCNEREWANAKFHATAE